MTPSQQCFDLVTAFEGLFLKAYADESTPPVMTIGYGRTVNDNGSKIRPDQICTAVEALQWLDEDLEHEGWHFIDAWVKRELTQNEFDALTSFIYNCGCGTFKRKVLPYVNAGDMAAASVAMKTCDTAGGKPLIGLDRRRLAETCLLLGDVAGMKAALNG